MSEHGPDVPSDAMGASERIGKLFLLFLQHPGGLSFRQIRRLMPEAYRGEAEAVRKKFQRDRKDLRALGLHLEESSAGAAGSEENRILVTSATGRTLLSDIRLSEQQRSCLAGLILRRLRETEATRPAESEESTADNATEADLYRSIYLKLFYDRTEIPDEAPALADDPGELYPTERSDLSETLREIQEAMADRRKLSMVYTNARGETRERTVQPLALNIYRRVWYLSAWCEEAKDYRLFHVDRIAGPRRLDRSIDSHLPEIVNQLKPHPLNLRHEELQRIVVRLNPDYEEHFDHFTKELPAGYRLKTGEHRREIDTRNPEALFFWMFRYPGAVTGLGPELVHGRFKKFLTAIIERSKGAPCP